MSGTSEMEETNSTDDSVTIGTLLTTAVRRLRATPSAVLALVLAGLVVTGIDRLRVHDPIPTTGFAGVQQGQFSVASDVAIPILSRAHVPLSALVDLKTEWLVWTVGLSLLGFVTVVGAGAYAISRLLSVPLTAGAVVRYGALAAFFRFFTGRVSVHGGAAILALPVVIASFVLLVRLFPLPGLLIADYPLWHALRRSWRLARGRGGTLFGIVLLVGVLNHLLASVPVVGPLGSSLGGVLHAGVVAAFLRQTAAEW